MQILQRLFRVSHEPSKETTVTSSGVKKKEHNCDQQGKSIDITVYKVEASYLCCSNFSLLTILRGRDIAKTCLYNTSNLKRLGSFGRRQQCLRSMKMKKEDIARAVSFSHKQADSGGHGGNKVLPVSSATTLSTPTTNVNNNQYATEEKKDKPKGDKTKTIYKIKELLRWAAANKSEKGGKYIGRMVLQFRNGAVLKPVLDYDQLNIESPKISFRWDVQGCSSTSSVISIASSSRIEQKMTTASVSSTRLHDGDHCTARIGNWVTTDTEFVVLEL